MKAIVSSLAIVGVSFTSAQSGKYFVGSGHVSFDGAAKECAKAGAKLATFHNDANYATASNLCKTKCETAEPGNSGCGCWIGLKDDLVEGTWRWTDASAKDYSMTSSGAATKGVYPWHNGEPNNAGGNEDCAHIWKPQGYDLNDIPCGNANYYAMCEEFTDSEFKDYYTVDTRTTFSNAQSLCANELDGLASFHSDAEYYLAQSVCMDTCVASGTTAGCGCYVGFTDSGTEGLWIYSDGSANDYGVDTSTGKATYGLFPWHAGEPNNVGTGGEDCAHIWEPQGYLLNDIPCESTTYQYFPLCLDTGITLAPTPAPTCETEKPNQPQLSITLTDNGVSVFENGLFVRVLNATEAPTKKKGKGSGKGGKKKGKVSYIYEWSEWKPLTGECGKLRADMTDYFDDFQGIDGEWVAVAIYNCGSSQFSIDSVGIWNGKKAKTLDYFCSGVAGPSRGCGATATDGSIGTCEDGFAEVPYNMIVVDDDECSALSFTTEDQSTGGANTAMAFALSDPGIPSCVELGFAQKVNQQHVNKVDNVMNEVALEQDMTINYGAAAAVMVAGAALYACYRHQSSKKYEKYQLIH